MLKSWSYSGRYFTHNPHVYSFIWLISYNLILQEASPQRELSPLAPVLEARRILLSILPRILACMTSLWKASDAAERNENNQQKYIMGNPKVSKKI